MAELLGGGGKGLPPPPQKLLGVGLPPTPSSYAYDNSKTSCVTTIIFPPAQWFYMKNFKKNK